MNEIVVGASKERIAEAYRDIEMLRDRAADIFLSKDKDYVAANHREIQKIQDWIRRNS